MVKSDMARTVQNLVDEVRRLLIDVTVPYRTSDEAIASLITDYLTELFRLRPDAYVPYSTNRVLPTITPANFSDSWPVPDQFYKAGVYHVVGNVELQDDEHVLSQRAEMMINKSLAMLQDHQ